MTAKLPLNKRVGAGTDMTSALDGFTKFEFDDGRWTREVYRIGSGPAVIVIHEMPGLHPGVLAFARDVAAAGMTVFCPSLFGKPAKPVSMAYALGEIAKTMCVRREFTVWATDRSSPIVDWLRALARQAHERGGGPGVGAIGMCCHRQLRPLSMMLEPVDAGAGAVAALIAVRQDGRGLASACSASEISCARHAIGSRPRTCLCWR